MYTFIIHEQNMSTEKNSHLHTYLNAINSLWNFNKQIWYIWTGFVSHNVLNVKNL